MQFSIELKWYAKERNDQWPINKGRKIGDFSHHDAKCIQFLRTQQIVKGIKQNKNEKKTRYQCD